MKSSFRVCFAVLLASLFLNAAEQHGQVKFGGLGVPGVTVMATRGDKTQTVITDQQGTYTFPDLADGSWTFQVEMLCFTPIKQDVSITTGLPAPDWDLKLIPLDQIEAAAGPAAPKPAAIQMSTNQPAPAAAQAKNAKAKKGAPTPPPQTSFRQTDVNASAAAAVAPPPPASDAFANQNPADLNQRASDGLLINGSQSNAASSPFSQSNAFGNNRRGTRSLYTGNISFIANNSALDAKPFSLTGQDTPKSAQNLLQGGFSIQGPLRIPRLLPRNGPIFVVNYQYQRNRTAVTTPYLVPTGAERNGDFSQALNALGQPAQIFNPTTGAPFTGNMIPPTQINPQAQALLNFYPLPNFAGGSRYNYQTSLINITSRNSLQTRLIKPLGNKDQVFGNFSMQDTHGQSTNLFGFVDQTRTLGTITEANWRHTLPNRVILHFSDTFSRLSSTTSPYFENRENVSGEAGISGNNQQSLNWGPPSLSFGTSAIAGLSDANAAANHNQTNKVSFDGLWYRSPHSFTWGADFARLAFNTISQSNPRGAFAFTGAAAGYDFADFLLGIPDTASLAFGNADKYFRSNSWDAFVNDDWRVSPGFTFNWGLRWEYTSPISELFGRLVNLAVGPNFSTANQVVAGNSSNSLLHPDLHEFQPRLSFSWRPFPASSMVVRGGYGVYYNTSVYQTIATNMAQQPPLSRSFSIPNSLSSPLTLATAFNSPPGATPNTFAIDPDFRVGYAQNWQLSVQRDLPKGLLMTATYMGIKGTRAVQEFLPNTYPVGGVSSCPACPVGYLYMTSNGNSTRESGQFQLRRRLHAGLTASVDYTYSKSIDDAALGGRGTANPVIAQNWLNLSGERGLSPFDQRHLVSASAQYTTGMGVSGGTLLDGWKGTLYKEWTFLTQANIGSGLPETPTLGQAIPGTGFTSILRPNFTGAPLYQAPSGLFLNPASFGIPAAGQWGNAGRDTITGPSQFTLNASVSRTFRVSDRFNMDLRVDANNALNHVSYQNYVTVVGSPLFGLPGIAGQMRQIQTTLRLRF
ncbi:MAG TPA: carboxypeptidase regulatory-like domain-containing protein [Bryobacteraceae bacterium]|jgi:hypothetical protein|nr:carboxypeptidase regulatory-like domain-containing protein [Bryobacteraceae bacterium]